MSFINSDVFNSINAIVDFTNTFNKISSETSCGRSPNLNVMRRLGNKMFALLCHDVSRVESRIGSKRQTPDICVRRLDVRRRNACVDEGAGIWSICCRHLPDDRIWVQSVIVYCHRNDRVS